MIEQFGTLEPVIIADGCGVSIVNHAPRLFRLAHGDIFTLNHVAVKQAFGIPIKHIKLGEKINQFFICMEKIKRKHWWQFWKPKYIGAKFMYVEKENQND